MNEPVGFIRDIKTWRELLDWVLSQNFADHANKTNGVPYRIETILRRQGNMTIWDGTQLEWAKGFIAGHYAAKQPPTKPTTQP